MDTTTDTKGWPTTLAEGYDMDRAARDGAAPEGYASWVAAGRPIVRTTENPGRRGVPAAVREKADDDTLLGILAQLRTDVPGIGASAREAQKLVNRARANGLRCSVARAQKLMGAETPASGHTSPVDAPQAAQAADTGQKPRKAKAAPQPVDQAEAIAAAQAIVDRRRGRPAAKPKADVMPDAIGKHLDFLTRDVTPRPKKARKAKASA